MTSNLGAPFGVKTHSTFGLCEGTSGTQAGEGTTTGSSHCLPFDELGTGMFSASLITSSLTVGHIGCIGAGRFNIVCTGSLTYV